VGRQGLQSTALSEQERYNWIEFHKWMLKGQWFTPLTRNGNLVLMARAEMGYLGHYNKTRYRPSNGSKSAATA
jgi:Surface antigen.